MFPKAVKVENEKYKRWIHEQPCLIDDSFCSSPETVVPHHIEGGGRRSDDKVVPLCLNHHTGDKGAHSLIDRFEIEFKVDLKKEAKRFWEEYNGKLKAR